jgi:peroxisomal 3,2-trans-enoyl-CoA isomerase
MENSELVIKKEQGVLSFRLNRPQKKNAINSKMLQTIVTEMEKAIKDDSVKVIYWTGTGEFYSSGNDFNNFSDAGMDEIIAGFEQFINFLITYPKVIIAGVNGMCFGVAFTMLALFDIALCADTAVFTTPFVQTYQTPEGCSSLLFPLIMGKSNAGHLLINGGVINAQDAKELGVVSKVFEKEHFEKDAYDYALKCATHDLAQLMKIKSIISKNITPTLIEVNKEESKQLRLSWNNKKFQDIIKKFVKNPKF